MRPVNQHFHRPLARNGLDRGGLLQRCARGLLPINCTGNPPWLPTNAPRGSSRMQAVGRGMGTHRGVPQRPCPVRSWPVGAAPRGCPRMQAVGRGMGTRGGVPQRCVPRTVVACWGCPPWQPTNAGGGTRDGHARGRAPTVRAPCGRRPVGAAPRGSPPRGITPRGVRWTRTDG